MLLSYLFLLGATKINFANCNSGDSGDHEREQPIYCLQGWLNILESNI